MIKYSVKANESRQVELVPRILSYLKYLPIYQWDDVIVKKGTCSLILTSILSSEIGSTLPDNVTFTLVSGLLCIAHQRDQVSSIIYETLWNYGKTIIELMEAADSKTPYLNRNSTDYFIEDYVVSFILPSLAGLARALQVSPYLYSKEQLQSLCQNLQPLIVDSTLDNIKNAIDSCLRETDTESYSRRVLASYWEAGTPLSSNRIIHDLLIVFRNATARMIAISSPKSSEDQIDETIDLRKLHLTSNIDSSWSLLMKKVAAGSLPPKQDQSKLDEQLSRSLRGTYVMSLGYYDDTRNYAERREHEGKKWSLDSYMNQIRGTSLVSKN